MAMTEYILKKLADLVFARITNALQNDRATPQTSPKAIEAAVQHHLREVQTWAAEISFEDLKSVKVSPETGVIEDVKFKRTSDAFVPLDLLLQPRRLRLSPEEQVEVRPLERVLNETPGHIIILGQPGAGKTTSMKHVCNRLLEEDEFMRDLNFPVVIRLRELSGRYQLADKETEDDDVLLAILQRVLELEIRYPPLPQESEPKSDYDLRKREALAQRTALRRRALTDAIDTLAVLIILDGLDEIPSGIVRGAVVESLRRLARQLNTSRIILTARTGEFTYHIENVLQFEIHPLTDDQISAFATRWLGAEAGRSLLSTLRVSPFSDTAIRPLTIAHLCAIYERIGKIPEKPKTVYRKVVSLLLEK